VIAYFHQESDAYEFEDQRIREYGKSNLCNVAPLMGGEEKATVNPYLSDAFMHLMAIGYKSKAGRSNDYSGRPFAAAVHLAFMRRFDAFVEAATNSVGIEALRAGVAKFGVDLQHGR